MWWLLLGSWEGLVNQTWTQMSTIILLLWRLLRRLHFSLLRWATIWNKLGYIKQGWGLFLVFLCFNLDVIEVLVIVMMCSHGCLWYDSQIFLTSFWVVLLVINFLRKKPYLGEDDWWLWWRDVRRLRLLKVNSIFWCPDRMKLLSIHFFRLPISVLVVAKEESRSLSLLLD